VIQHFLEVWLFLVTAFAIGCVVGATVYLALAATFLASLQVALARTVRYGIDGVLERLGAAPAWREYPYVPTDAAPARYEDGGEQSGRREAGVALTPDFPTSRDDHGRDDLSLTRPALRAPAERGPTPIRPMALSRPRNGVPNNPSGFAASAGKRSVG